LKLHKDGTVEGTPEEIAEYNRLSAIIPDKRYLIDWLAELNKQACTATGSEQHKKIISEADKVRWLIQLQQEHWKNRKPEDRPKVMYGEKYGENLAKSLEEMEKRTGSPKSEILLYAIKGTNLE